MEINDLLVENIYAEECPQYLKSYEKFHRFMTMMSNYVKFSFEDVLEEISQKFSLQFAKGDLLEKLANNMNIEIDKYLAGDNYEYDLSTAIRGGAIQKTFDGSISSLKEQILNLFPEITSLTVKDKGVIYEGGQNQPMYLEIGVVGTVSYLDQLIIQSYVIPKITGVNTSATYILFGKDIFGRDFDEETEDQPEHYKILGWDKGEWVERIE